MKLNKKLKSILTILPEIDTNKSKHNSFYEAYTRYLPQDLEQPTSPPFFIFSPVDVVSYFIGREGLCRQTAFRRADTGLGDIAGLIPCRPLYNIAPSFNSAAWGDHGPPGVAPSVFFSPMPHNETENFKNLNFVGVVCRNGFHILQNFY